MDFYNAEENVNSYIKMAEGYDGAELIEILKKYLPLQSSVLELGMGPGKDLDLLSNVYTVTGSDASAIFLDRYRKKNEGADLLQLDAEQIDTDRRFDAIYSNKVLHHLTRAALRSSLRRQHKVLNRAGICLHSFWHGEQEETHHGLRFVYYTEQMLTDAVGTGFEILALERYSELEEGDSLYIVLRKVQRG